MVVGSSIDVHLPQQKTKTTDAATAPKEKTISMPSEARPFWTALTFNAVDLSQQLAVLQFEKLRAVTPAALADTPSWVAEDGKAVSANSPVRQLIDWTNQVQPFLLLFCCFSFSH